jgi:hypothetical protein
MPDKAALKTWNAGETLTAADLNAEITNARAGYNANVLDGANLSTTAVNYQVGALSVGHSALLTTSAAHNLQAVGTAAADSGGTLGRWSADAAGPVLSLIKSRNATLGSTTIVADNDVLGTLEFMADDGGDFATPGATIFARVNGTPGANNLPTELVFSVTADGANSVTEALKIEQDRKATFSGAVTVGVDDTGYDVKLFGASAGAYMEWDESADQLRLLGPSADAAGSSGKLLLATAQTAVTANDILGQIDFQAPLETGTDAVEISASIRAIAQGAFGAGVNATDLIFYTGHSEVATEKIRITSQGEIGIGGANYGTDGQVLTSAGAGAAVAWEAVSAGVSLSGSTNNTVATVTGANALIGEANLTFDGTLLTCSGTIAGGNAAGPAIIGDEAATATNPTLVPNKTEEDTGIGWAAADALTIVTGGTEQMRIISTGEVGINVVPTGTRQFEISAAGASDQGIFAHCANASLTGNAILASAARASNSAFNLFVGYSGTTSALEFKVTGEGNVTADGTFTGNGADYQEFFESTDGEALGVGKSIVLENDKVRVYNASTDSTDAILGVVRPKEDSKNSAVIGNTAWNHWTDMYLTDEWGVYEREDKEILSWTDAKGREVAAYADSAEAEEAPDDAVSSVDSVRKLNPAYTGPTDVVDPDYVPRQDRDEWNLIGLLGQVQIKTGEATNPRWRKMKDVSASVELWFVR